MSGETFEGKRFRLRPVTERDISVLYEWYRDPTVMSLYDGIHFWAEDLESFREEYRLWLNEEVRLGFAGSFMMDLKESGQPVGECTWVLVDRTGPDSPGVFQVGGLIGDRQLHGQGYGTEALKLLRDYLFEHCNAHRLEAITRAFNSGAMKTLHRNGFSREGVLREAVLVDGKWQDRVLFSLLRYEWEQGANPNHTSDRG